MADPFAPTASVVDVESSVWRTVEQSFVEQTWNVTLPVSCVSGSPKVAVSVGVSELTYCASDGVARAGAVGAMSAVLFVNEPFVSEPSAAALPIGTARSRIVSPEPGVVYVSSSESR